METPITIMVNSNETRAVNRLKNLIAINRMIVMS